MVKRRSTSSQQQPSFHQSAVDLENTMIVSSSMRSMESFSSNTTSSVCSDDPSMRRTIPTDRLRNKQRPSLDLERRTLRVTDEMECDGDLRVTFSPMISEVVCEVENRMDFTLDETKMLFLTMNDMNQIKSDAKYTTKYYRSREKCTIDHLDQAYTYAIYRATSFSTHDDFIRFIKNDDGEFERVAELLNLWCRSYRVTGRGLERYCSQKQRTERQKFSAECRAAVVRLSKSTSVSEDDLAKFYHEYSRGNTIYARMMGHADKVSVENIRRIENMRHPTQLKACSDRNFDRHKVRLETSRMISILEQTNEGCGGKEIEATMSFGGVVELSETQQCHQHQVESSNSNILSLDRRQRFALQRQSSSAKLLARLSNRSL